MLYPLTFHPIFKERVWGDHKIEEIYHKPLPANVPIGESWEISDRPGDVNVIANGAFAGKDLHWLIEAHSSQVLGSAPLHQGRFPLLIKILDAREKLSLQVHPPAEVARTMGGEPKTEMWYIAEAEPGAELFVGLKNGVTRQEFERKVQNGTVAECFHRIKVKAGDAMFLPSGRVHAIGPGLVIFEIQQNSDTTYRVFDWNRVGLDGKPRALHIRESMASINFNDFEPALISAEVRNEGQAKIKLLVKDPSFCVELYEISANSSIPVPANLMQIIGVVQGDLGVGDGTSAVDLSAGGFSLIPASLQQVTIRTKGAALFLRVRAGQQA